MSVELRKLKRFEGGEEAFVAFIRPDEPIIVGKIIDISSGGLGVRYLAAEKFGEGPSLVEVFGPSSIRVDRIKSTVIYDREIPEESMSSLSVRRCGIKFEQRCHSAGLLKFINSTCSDAVQEQQLRSDVSKNKGSRVEIGI
jgi:hypothetical protein